ncbi:hypothetical protein K438DRAFT_1783269 [Mycena galopus ATCC 62051]|nr:hypothetical protein K438DRAFT_1783269 [Mycena galopus ATCC 62051]
MKSQAIVETLTLGKFKSMEGQALVAKRFYCIIYLELRHLMVGAYFLKQFFMAARCQGVDVYTAIEFTDAWLGQEIQVTPTKASGAAKVDDMHEGIMWLTKLGGKTSVPRPSTV